jgi:hypothetical protein
MSPKQRVKYMKKNVDAIFVGTVKSVTQGDGLVFRAVLTIDKFWKGKNVGEQVVFTSGGCRVGFEKDNSYLVYAKGDKNNDLVTEVCWGTRLRKFANDDIKRLGKPRFVVETKTNGRFQNLTNIWNDSTFLSERFDFDSQWRIVIDGWFTACKSPK